MPGAARAYYRVSIRIAQRRDGGGSNRIESKPIQSKRIASNATQRIASPRTTDSCRFVFLSMDAMHGMYVRTLCVDAPQVVPCPEQRQQLERESIQSNPIQ
uniref:Uncharacterized protein n=1 Tax=Pseudo-nitzschia australis TaxID=44445 RepID=A0A7S4AFE5_9STRA